MDNDSSIFLKDWIEKSDKLISDINSMEMNNELREKIADFIFANSFEIKSMMNEINDANEIIYECRQLCCNIINGNDNETDDKMVLEKYPVGGRRR